MTAPVDHARTAAAALGRLVARHGAHAISVAILLAALVALRTMDWPRVLAMVPRTPAFWAVFAVAYLVPVVADWAIYRRIWGMGVGGLLPMLRKMIGNELLLGYLGEAYLFAWARRAGHGGAAAFGAVKDVALLSAVVGNGATLLVAAAAMPFVGVLALGMPPWTIALSIAIIVAPPIVALLFRRKLFSLPAPELRRIAGIHAVRAVATISLTALLWHLALPAVAVAWLLVLSALKLVVSRLPLVSNKDLVFAGMTALLLGRADDIAALMTMMAVLMLTTHIVVGLVASASEVAPALATLVRRRRTAVV